ncbi:MAG: hypothetical protein BBJ60_00065 [Desulfobacterales bacterium S7086C20]|nr:MAG: hypothetical protein BBJ60_00065 [Desulfobacterales bacterium S7086C20]
MGEENIYENKKSKVGENITGFLSAAAGGAAVGGPWAAAGAVGLKAFETIFSSRKARKEEEERKKAAAEEKRRYKAAVKENRRGTNLAGIDMLKDARIRAEGQSRVRSYARKLTA